MWKISGWLLAKSLLALCCVSGLGEKRAARSGRWLRGVLPWRLSSAASRSMADGSSKNQQVSWMVFAWVASTGLCCAYFLSDPGVAILAACVGISPALWLAYAGKCPDAKLAKGALWLGLVSSSELCLSLGKWPAAPKGSKHVGFAELALRLCEPDQGESLAQLRARARLRAMMMACAGSKLSAKWLWRRRSGQRSMAQWAKDWSLLSKGKQSWELSSSLMAIEAVFQAGGAEGHIAYLADAAELSEATLPLMWAKPPKSPHLWSGGDDFDSQLQEEVLRLSVGDEVLPWGWRQEQKAREFASSVVKSWAFKKEWNGFISAALPLLEANKLKLHLGKGPEPSQESAKSKRL